MEGGITAPPDEMVITADRMSSRPASIGRKPRQPASTAASR